MLLPQCCEEVPGSLVVAMAFQQEQNPAQYTQLVIGMVALTL